MFGVGTYHGRPLSLHGGGHLAEEIVNYCISWQPVRKDSLSWLQLCYQERTLWIPVQAQITTNKLSWRSGTSYSWEIIIISWGKWEREFPAFARAAGVGNSLTKFLRLVYRDSPGSLCVLFTDTPQHWGWGLDGSYRDELCKIVSIRYYLLKFYQVGEGEMGNGRKTLYTFLRSGRAVTTNRKWWIFFCKIHKSGLPSFTSHILLGVSAEL